MYDLIWGLFHSNKRIVAQWLKETSALSQEISRFVQARLEEDLAASFALASWHDLQDVIECRRRSAAKAAEQYSEEIAKLPRTMPRVMTAGVGVFGRGRAQMGR